MKILKKINKKTQLVVFDNMEKGIFTFCDDGRILFSKKNSGTVVEIKKSTSNQNKKQDFKGEIYSPSLGTIVSLLVKPNEVVLAGKILCVIEVMKMNFEIKSPCHLKIVEVNISENQLVKNNQLIFKAEEVKS